MTHDASINIPPDLELIPTVRLMLRRALPQLDTDDDALYFSAVTEILANAIAAHGDRPHSPIRIGLSLDGRPETTVVDRGPGFDPADPPNQGRSDGRGNGLTIARAACPDMTISSGQRGTTVRLPFGPGSPR